MPRFIHQSHEPLALELALICPAQHGRWPGWRGWDTAWTLGVSRAGSPKPHQVGDSSWEGSGCPCRPAAGCLSFSCTMSDGEGPSAGEWQRYIYPRQVRLQSEGHGSQGALPLPPGLMPRGPVLLEGGSLTFKAKFCPPPRCTPASLGGCGRKLCLLRTPPLSARALRAGPRCGGALGCGWTPGWAQGAMEQALQADECVNFYLKWGAHSSHQLPEGLRPVGSSEPLVGQHGPPGPLGWGHRQRRGGQTLGLPVPSVLPLVRVMVRAALRSFPLKAKL